MSAARWSNQVVFRWSEGLASGEQTASKERGIILVTGGAGHVGSHACVELLNAGEQVVVFDNFCNSNPSSLDRVQMICSKSLIVVQGDIRDQVALESTLTKYRCTAVLHFAGLKSVQDSVARPLEYYDHNVIGSYRLLCAMQNTVEQGLSSRAEPGVGAANSMDWISPRAASPCALYSNFGLIEDFHKFLR